MATPELHPHLRLVRSDATRVVSGVVAGAVAFYVVALLSYTWFNATSDAERLVTLLGILVAVGLLIGAAGHWPSVALWAGSAMLVLTVVGVLVGGAPGALVGPVPTADPAMILRHGGRSAVVVAATAAVLATSAFRARQRRG